MESLFVRRLFRILNRTFMVPVFRLGLGPLIVNPLTGYILVLKTTGHKTGKTRFTPVNYTLWRGNIYCLAGAGQVTHWVRNLKANPLLEVLLPGRAVSAAAQEVKNQQEKAQVVRQIYKNGGFVGFLMGLNPYTASDEKLLSSVAGVPVMRLRPNGLGSGPSDAGGWLWLPVLAGMIVVIVRLF